MEIPGLGAVGGHSKGASIALLQGGSDAFWNAFVVERNHTILLKPWILEEQWGALGLLPEYCSITDLNFFTSSFLVHMFQHHKVTKSLENCFSFNL